jgi:hypothetical protein
MFLGGTKFTFIKFSDKLHMFLGGSNCDKFAPSDIRPIGT